jgi:hypothetical protein
MQWADIEHFIAKSLPQEGETPVYFLPFSEDLVLDFRRHKLWTFAQKAAKLVRVRRRFKADFRALLDEAGLEYRERSSPRAGKVFALNECPYCHGHGKAYVTRTGKLRCFRTSCSACEGLPPEEWTKDFGLELEFVSERTETEDFREAQRGLLEAEAANARLRMELSRIHHLEPGKALLVMATPGLGKTSCALWQVERFAGNVIVATDTKERAKDLFEQYAGHDARLIVGRGEDNCEKEEKIKIIGQKGYAPGMVFCPRCPFFPKNAKTSGRAPCGYYDQFGVNRPRVTFCTYEQALYLHEAGALEADLILLDEDPTRAFIHKIALQIPHLMFNDHSLPFPVRQFTALLRQALREASAIEEKRAIYRGKLLSELLLITASVMGVNIEKVMREVTNCLENVYDKPGRLAHLSTEELEGVPPAYLLDLANALLQEIAHTSGGVGEDWNSPLSVHVFRGVATLYFYSRFTLTKETPLVILDAYGREDYYKALLGREVETLTVNALIHAKVIKVKLATSKRAFKARHDALFRRLDEVILRYQAQKILVYTHAALEAEVNAKYPFVATQHFWSGRGKDEFKDLDVVILFGTAEPDPQDLLDECRALHSDEDVPIDPQPHPDNHRHRKDERLQTLLLMRREEEMEQAAHRLRPVWGEGNEKTIIIMSHLDLPGLSADEVIDPRAIEGLNRKELLAQFIADCIDQMGFYCDGLAELAGVVEIRSKVVEECRLRLARTASLIDFPIRKPVQPRWDADSLYPANRNAMTRERNAILSQLELEEESLSFELASGKWVTIKVWGSVSRAAQFFRALMSDSLEPPVPFSEEKLCSVCQREAMTWGVLFGAPTVRDAYSPVFSSRLESDSPIGAPSG